jgi:hypothetical protein
MAEDRLSLHALLLRLSESYPLRQDQLQVLTDLLEEKGITEEVFAERQAKAADKPPEATGTILGLPPRSVRAVPMRCRGG